MSIRAFASAAFFLLLAGIAQPQSTPLTCLTGAVNPSVRSEGIAEQLGDIVLNCSGGAPGTVITVNLAISLNVGVTNRISTAGATDVSLTVDTGAGPVAASVPGLLQSSNTVSFNGLSFTVPATGGVNIRIGNLRGNASQIGFGSQRPIVAVMSINGVPSPITLNNTGPLSVAIPTPGLLATLSSAGIRCVGSPLPPVISFSNLYNGGTRFVSTRVTEGYPDAFQKKAGTADSGIRILVRYTGLPAGARLFVPDVVAGSDTVQPTAAGDLGGAPSAGAYAPGGAGSLLLARVNGTDANGAGGTLAFTPGPSGSGTVAFDSASEVKITNGSGIAVYEVVDANPSVRESAQFPTFLGMPATTDGTAPIATEQVSFAPVSTVFTASSTDPIPRFIPNPPPSDCPTLLDCNAAYFPSLSVTASQVLEFTALSGSFQQTKTVQVNNKGGGVLSWTATAVYSSGANWLTVNPAAGVNGGTVLVTVLPQNLAPGVFKATLIIDGGPQSGNQSMPITLTVTALPPLPAPPAAPPTPAPPTPAVVAPKVVLQSLASAARPDSTAVAPGSLAIVKGSNFKGRDVSVTFDGIPATILSADDQSISVQLPPSLPSGILSQLQVTVDGEKSAALAVPIAELAPAIFAHGVLNADGAVNSESNPAAVGSQFQIFSTGLIATVPGPVMVKLHDRKLTPLYAGPAPGLLGVNQVNIAIPDDLPAMTTELAVCGFGAVKPDQPICSQPVSVTLQ